MVLRKYLLELRSLTWSVHLVAVVLLHREMASHLHFRDEMVVHLRWGKASLLRLHEVVVVLLRYHEVVFLHWDVNQSVGFRYHPVVRYFDQREMTPYVRVFLRRTQARFLQKVPGSLYGREQSRSGVLVSEHPFRIVGCVHRSSFASRGCIRVEGFEMCRCIP